jgi:hypothetical protein
VQIVLFLCNLPVCAVVGPVAEHLGQVKVLGLRLGVVSGLSVISNFIYTSFQLFDTA